MINSAVSNLTGLGGKYLDNKGEIANAKAGYELAKLAAKTEQASTEMKYEIEKTRQTFTLDELAVQQAGKTIWDEILCVIALAPLALICYGVVVSVPPEQWGWNILMAFANVPAWYLVVIGLIYVRYLGFRTLLRMGLKIWGKKIFDVNIKAEDGHERKTKADKQG